MASLSGAPVTKGLMIFFCSSSVVSGWLSRQFWFSLRLKPDLSRDHQLWRLAVHQLAFTNSSELLLGILVLFFTAVPVERTFGSLKFFRFVALAFLIETLAEVVALVGLRSLPSGPFGLIFAIVGQSWELVPTLFNFKVFGLTVPNRVLLFVPASQLFASQSIGSAVVCCCGLATSSLARSWLGSLWLSDRAWLLLTRVAVAIVGESAPARRGTVASIDDVLAAGGVRRPTATAAPSLVEQWQRGLGRPNSPAQTALAGGT